MRSALRRSSSPKELVDARIAHLTKLIRVLVRGPRAVMRRAEIAFSEGRR